LTASAAKATLMAVENFMVCDEWAGLNSETCKSSRVYKIDKDPRILLYTTRFMARIGSIANAMLVVVID
jgi:hypothetical protein